MAINSNVIFVDPNADISEVVELIVNAKSDQLIISLPHRALILQSLINLQLLGKYAELYKKQITIATTDSIGQQLAKQAGIELHQTDSDQSSEMAETLTEALVMDDPSDAKPHHLTPLSGFRKKSLIPIAVESAAAANSSRKATASHPWKLPALRLPSLRLDSHTLPQPKLTLALSGIGLILLAAVGFFVLPKAYAAIEVQSESFSKQFTLTLADIEDSQAVGTNVLAGRFVETSREQVATFKATGEVNKGEKAGGQINVVNYTSGIQGILANTRFVNEAGLIFRIKADILVPPARGNIAGRAVMDAVAEEGGAKYNLSSPSKLTIPNLSEGLKPLLYGEVVGAFSGGTDNIVKAVSQEDLDKAKEEVAKNIFVSAESDLGKKAKRNEQLNPDFIQNDIIDAVPSVTAGAEQDEFEIRVQSRSWTILIPQNSLATAIANAAAFEIDPAKQVTDQTLAAATVEPVESNFITHQISLVVSLNGRVGPRLDREAIIKAIINKPKSQAATYLQSLDQATSTSLDVWPTFISRVPLVASNIKLRVIYLGE